MNKKILHRNNVTVFGEGETPLVFAHGFGCDQNMWRFITPAFKKEYKIILFDYVGSGRSDVSAYKSERYNSLNGYARDILDILHAMDLHDVIFVGHSVSSMIGALVAIEEPQRFKSLIMIGPSPCYLNEEEYKGGFEHSTIQELLGLMGKNYIGWANFFAPEVMKNEDKPELTAELEESFCSTDPIIANEFARATFLADNREDLPKINVPVLIIQSEEDTIAPIAIGEYVHSNIKESTFKLISAKGHCPHMSHPDETITAIKGFFDQYPKT